MADEVTPPAAPQPGPWAADLAEYFGDNQEAIAAADRYMREKVQPRITHLETESAPARELYKDLMDDADGTLAAVVEELYGEDQAEAFRNLLTPAEQAVVDAAAAASPVEGAPQETKEQREMREWYERKRDQEAREEEAASYQEVLAGLREAHPDLTDQDIELIHPFMSAAGGDTEAAYAGYQAYTQAFKTRLGVAEPEPAPDPSAELPPVLDGTGAAAAQPPVEKKYASIDDAMDDWFAERRPQAPPPVM